MRKFLITAAAAVSALAVAAPAASQIQVSVGTPYGYGYGTPYGYNNNYGQVRSLQVRLNNLERQISRLDRRNVLSDREANRLRWEANSIERRLRQASYNGLNWNESRDIQYRIARLEQNIQYQARDGNRYSQYGGYGGYGAYGYDRDRDGLDDRYERDRGTNFDEDGTPD